MIATPPPPPPAAKPPGSNGHLPHEEKILGGDPLEYISASRLKSFLTCRLRFYFEKVLAIPKPLGPSLHFGRAVHAGLQHYNKARWRGGDTSETAVISAYQQAFDTPEKNQPVAFDTAEEKAELRAKGEPLLRAFLNTKQIAPEKKPMGVELSLRAELPSLALPLLGVIDLVEADLTAVDYKTVASTPDLPLEAWLHEIQLTAYGLLIEEATGEAPSGSELVFLVKTKTPKVISHRLPAPSQVQRDRFARLVETYATGVANENYFPSPGMHCGWCEHRAECSAWKGGPE
jgi:putative RecB family exonuclease